MYYASGWNIFGSGTSSTTDELLPVNYKFRISYGGANQEKWQDVGADPNVVFQTAAVTFKLWNSTGTSELNGGTLYYASGWNTFGGGTSTTSMELLPVNYKFRVTYGGASQEKWQNVSGNQLVEFQTGQVHSTSATATSYYASGWKTFVQDMELLPVSYKFRFSDATADTTYSIAQGTVTNIH